MEDKKYKLIENDFRIIPNDSRKVYRIMALRDFANVKKGDLGGYIEKEENLSHNGNAWVYDKGIVCDNAVVRQNAIVLDNAIVRNQAIVYGNATIRGEAVVSGNALVKDSAMLCNSACAGANSIVKGNSVMAGCSVINDYADIGGDVFCDDRTLINGRATLEGKINLLGCSHIGGDVDLCFSRITLQNADIFKLSQIVVFHGFGSRLSTTAIYRNMYGELSVTCGCFNGSIEEFKRKVHETHRGNVYAKEYRALIRAALRHNFDLYKEENEND